MDLGSCCFLFSSSVLYISIIVVSGTNFYWDCRIAKLDTSIRMIEVLPKAKLTILLTHVTAMEYQHQNDYICPLVLCMTSLAMIMEACQQKMLNQEAKIDNLRRLRIESASVFKH